MFVHLLHPTSIKVLITLTLNQHDYLLRLQDQKTLHIPFSIVVISFNFFSVSLLCIATVRSFSFLTNKSFHGKTKGSINRTVLREHVDFIVLKLFSQTCNCQPCRLQVLKVLTIFAKM